MEGGCGKEGRKDRENELAAEQDFRSVLRNVFRILHAVLVSHARRSFSTISVCEESWDLALFSKK
jgi:hypothetical protein